MARRLVRDHMSRAAHWVAADDPVTKARELMQYHAIRHLPVLDGAGKVVGMVSLGDLYALEAVAEVDPDETEVSEGMSRDVYTVPPETPLVEVAEEMAKRHIGSVMVVEAGELRGVFTTSDACRVLGEVLRTASG